MKVFISYRRKSWPIVRQLANELGNLLQAIVFVDLTSIDEADFEKSILRNLRDSDVFVLIVSEYTFAPERIHDPHDWVRREVREALTLNKPIVMVLIDGLLPPADLPADIRDLRRMQGIKFYPEYFDEAVADLAAFITRVSPIRLRDTQTLPVAKLVPALAPTQPNHPTITNATLRRATLPTVIRPNAVKPMPRQPLLLLALSAVTALGILGALVFLFLTLLTSRAIANADAGTEPLPPYAATYDDPLRPAQPALPGQPDMPRVVYAQAIDGSSDVFIADMTGKRPIRLTSHPANDTQPSLSPDGQWVLFVSDRDGDEEIFVMAVEGGEVRQLTHNQHADYSPSWSPDGQRIAFCSNAMGIPQIYLMNADGSGLRRMTGNFGGSFAPAWSPDGRRLAFHSLRTGNAEIFIIYVDGLTQVQLTNHRAEDTHPAWSPDGQFIAFSSDRDGKPQIYLMRANGSAVRRLTGDDRINTRPLWMPDGQHIVYECAGGRAAHCLLRREGSEWRSLIW